MVSQFPDASRIPELRTLWHRAFGDSAIFLDSFFQVAYSSNRCRCITQDGKVRAALYWFVCDCRGEKSAYLYAIATEESFRRQGLCRILMEETHALLRTQGFHMALLSPETPALAEMYMRFGYQYACGTRQIHACAGGTAIPVRPISAEQYQNLRTKFLPHGSVQQDATFFRLLADGEMLYAGSGFILAAHCDKGVLHAAEFLGDINNCPGILRALCIPQGTFCTIGEDSPKIFFLPLNGNVKAPSYFGPVLD